MEEHRFGHLRAVLRFMIVHLLQVAIARRHRGLHREQFFCRRPRHAEQLDRALGHEALDDVGEDARDEGGAVEDPNVRGEGGDDPGPGALKEPPEFGQLGLLDRDSSPSCAKCVLGQCLIPTHLVLAEVEEE